MRTRSNPPSSHKGRDMKRTGKNVLAIATTTALVLVLAACGPTAGVVADKAHEPAQMRTRTGTCMTVINGKTQPHACLKRERQQERWRVELRDGEHTGWRSVSRNVYDACDVGDYFDSERKTCD